MSQVNLITPFYNTNERLFINSLGSIQEPKEFQFTHIIVNDGSTNITHDELCDMIYRYRATSNTKIFLQPNAGPGAARNLAFKHLDDDCEYIAFLDSDDRLFKESLSRRAWALDLLRKVTKNTVAVYGNKGTLDIRNNANEYTLESVPEFDRQMLQQHCYIPSNSVMFSRAAFQNYIGTMLEDVRMAEDYNLWLKLSCLGNFVKINWPIYQQIIHGENLTLNPKVLENHWHDIQMCYQDVQGWWEVTRKQLNV